ncbi:MAG: HD domain-containing protein [Heliobacteriaceae bacterium]|jgi:HD-GYP domain-containing protein (c-di-GMP phosphodiesterase class II)|nr:HD domain-containing protein [Heliobacteriaceae bacterium]
MSEGKEFIRKGLACLEDKDYVQAKALFLQAQEAFKEGEYISICLSLTGLTEYLIDKNNYKTALALINDGAHMAGFSKSAQAKAFNEFALGNINFGEGNNDVALIHFKNALNPESDEFELAEKTQVRIRQLQNGFDFSMPVKRDPLVSLVKIGQSITAQTDINVLLTLIAEETKTAMDADRCTVFLLDKYSNELWSMVALGMDNQEIRFPADSGLAGYVVQTGETVNIADAYNDGRFNKDVDSKTGYRTKTILCMPIKNNNQEIIGAFQVLNKNEGVFTKGDEDLLIAIGGSASIALENAQLFEQQKQLYKEQKELFDSFIDTLATSIDARDKITAGHSTRVRLYTMLIVDALEMDERNKELMEKAAILHDIGKIGIRDSVLQKEGKLTDEEYSHIRSHAQITKDILDKIQTSADFKTITDIACSHHEKWDGTGYFRKLSGEDIPYGGRILAVSDVFDAITSKRHYRDKMPIANVIDILIKDSGKHFDKSIVDVFLQVPLDKIVEVFLTENLNILKDNDREVLSRHNLLDIINMVDENLVKLFNHYYLGNN